MAREIKRFMTFQQQHLTEKKKEPKGEGVLIFDEVKVISRLMWNSRSQKIIGLAMSPVDMSSLQDVYQLVNEKSAIEQTSYILQFLWRDLTSSFDVVGPYFTSSRQLESKFILSCILQTLRIFHLYGFHTCDLVCDDANANVCTLKSLCGSSGAYGMNSTCDRHRVNPCFSNPFDPEKQIFCIICPSHQVSLFLLKSTYKMSYIFLLLLCLTFTLNTYIIGEREKRARHCQVCSIENRYIYSTYAFFVL